MPESFVVNFDAILTKDLILSKVSEEEIFARYGVPVEEGVFCSPLRSDRHPTCQFYRRRNGRLYLHDHAGYFWGDCFDLVQHQERVNFGGALKRVAADFKLTDEVVLSQRIPSPKIDIPIIEQASVKIKRRDWNSEDRRYWSRWNFKRETLDFFKIFPVERVWINEESIYAYQKQGQEAYAYHFGSYFYKIYFPWRDKWRFIHNNSWTLQGYDQLPENGPFLVITKSLKDVAKMYEFSIPAIAPMSETTLPSIDQLQELSERFPRFILFYDNDWPGKRQMIRLLRKFRDKFQFDCVLMPHGYPKDFTDGYEKMGEERILSFIEHVKTELIL